MRWILLFSNLLPDTLMTLVLTFKEGLLVRQELLVSAWLLSKLTIRLRAERSIKLVLLNFCFTLSHDLKFLNTLLLPLIESMDVLHRARLILQFFLGTKESNMSAYMSRSVRKLTI